MRLRRFAYLILRFIHLFFCAHKNIKKAEYTRTEWWTYVVTINPIRATKMTLLKPYVCQSYYAYDDASKLAITHICGFGFVCKLWCFVCCRIKYVYECMPKWREKTAHTSTQCMLILICCANLLHYTIANIAHWSVKVLHSYIHTYTYVHTCVAANDTYDSPPRHPTRIGQMVIPKTTTSIKLNLILCAAAINFASHHMCLLYTH